MTTTAPVSYRWRQPRLARGWEPVQLIGRMKILAARDGVELPKPTSSSATSTCGSTTGPTCPSMWRPCSAGSSTVRTRSAPGLSSTFRPGRSALVAADLTTVVPGQAYPSGPGHRPVTGPGVFVGRDESAFHRATTADYFGWLEHVTPAAGCTRPIRLAGDIATIDPATGQTPRHGHTADMPDGVIYKPCGNRRDSRLPVLRPHLPARRLPARPRRPGRRQRHPRHRRHAPGRVRHLHRPLASARSTPAPSPPTPAPTGDAATADPNLPPPPRHRHLPARRGRGLLRPATTDDDPALGTPLCLDCYDHHRQVVWNHQRRRTVAPHHHRHHRHATSRRTAARRRGHRPDDRIRRSVVRQGRRNAAPRRRALPRHHPPRRRRPRPTRPPILPPPDGLDRRRPGRRRRPRRRHRRVHHRRRTPPTRRLAHRLGRHSSTSAPSTPAPTAPSPTAWSPGTSPSTPPRATEATGHISRRLTDDTIDLYADPDGTHTERLIDACWTLGAHRDWRRPAPVGTHARLRRPLPHQIPPLLRHLPPPARRPRHLATHRHRTTEHGHPTDDETTARSSTSSPSSAPAGTPPATPSSPTPPPPWPASGTTPPGTNSPPPSDPAPQPPSRQP